MKRDRRAQMCSDLELLGHTVIEYVRGQGVRTSCGIVKSVRWLLTEDYGYLSTVRYR